MERNNKRRRNTDKIFNMVDLIKLFVFLIGGGLAGTGVSFIAPTSAQLGFKVDSLNERVIQNEKVIIELRKDANLRYMRVEEYIKSNAEKDALLQTMMNQQIMYLNDKLDVVKDDLKEIKSMIKNRR